MQLVKFIRQKPTRFFLNPELYFILNQGQTFKLRADMISCTHSQRIHDFAVT